MFDRATVIIRGGGDLATGVAFRLHQVGFPIIVLELAWPLVVRRKVSLASAVHQGEATIENLVGRCVRDVNEALSIARSGIIPVLVSPELPVLSLRTSTEHPGTTESSKHYPVIVDARMAKRNIDTTMDQAHTVIGLGPGFSAGDDCHAVVETMRGHRLGRVIWDGKAQPNTGTPGIVGGHGAERVLRAPLEGIVAWDHMIGDRVKSGDVIGSIEDKTIEAPFAGVIRGLIMPGTKVSKGYKIGDIDSRSDVAACFTISDKALSIGGGVLEAILTRINPPEWTIQ
jgi:xanthine dehydrogenase accessory factor